MSTVSVIVPNYNHEKFLRRRVESILGQTFQDFELILLDDCSTDDSRSVLRQYAGDPRLRIEFNEKNSGNTFKQWNKGIKLARGRYIWIAESDDYADVRFLERLVPVLENEKDVVFAYCRSWRTDDEDQIAGFVDCYAQPWELDRWDTDFSEDGRAECENYFIFGNSVPNASAVLFRKDACDAVGGADEGFRVCGDWKFWAAMALRGRIAYTAEPLNYFRCHNASVRSQGARSAVDTLEILRAIRWILGQVTPSASNLDEMRTSLARLWMPTALSFRVPCRTKRAVLQEIKKIDPHFRRRVFGPAMMVARLKIKRHWRELSSLISSALNRTTVH